ncbi:MAG: hypothetical protein OXP71_15210 [Candidatus Poribacteria bacterium]|nr:hypothetical protein [Candidatus Poribacteria bacterium]
MVSIEIPIMFGIMSIFFLSIGLRGILTKQPFLISNRWWLPIFLVVFIPMVLLPLSGSSLPSAFKIMSWVHPLMFGVILLMVCYQLKGYMAWAVTDKSFREALVAALEKLQLPYEERLSVIRLTTIDADLQVAIQSWTGTGIIKVKQREYHSVLREVVNEMNEYFRTSSVPTKMISCFYCLVMGGIMVVFAIGMFFFRNIFVTV